MGLIRVAAVLAFASFAARGFQNSPSFELEELSIPQLQDGMKSGKWSARRLVELYLTRIREIDRGGPTLRSIIELNPDAISIADQLDAERREGKLRGPLHGVPIVIKDNIDTGDKMMTTAGSFALEGSPATRDAFVVERLRQSGAVILGKTNLTEWANFRSYPSSSGWSGRGGQVRNPYVLDRSPCGSSSGSAVATAANLAAAAIGTETSGSIVCPAAANGVVGIKPTVGLVSRSGIIPISKSYDTAGPLARTVADAAVLLTAIAGSDPGDSATIQSTGRTEDYTRALNAGALDGARIGIARQEYFGYSASTDRVIADAIALMRSKGAVIVDPSDIPTASDLNTCSFDVMLFEFKTGVNEYLTSRDGTTKVKSLQDLIAFNATEREREMRFFGQEILEMAQAKGPLTSDAYRKALTNCRSRARTLGIDAVMTKHKLDALIAPTNGPAWPNDPVNGDLFLGSSAKPAAVAGYPHITVPAGQVHGLPVGVSFFGTAWSEAKLISIAYAYEQATKHRTLPQFRPTVQ